MSFVRRADGEGTNKEEKSEKANGAPTFSSEGKKTPDDEVSGAVIEKAGVGGEDGFAIPGERGTEEMGEPGETGEPDGDDEAVLEPRRCLPRRCNDDSFSSFFPRSSRRGRPSFSKYTEMLKGRWLPPAARGVEKHEKKRKRARGSRAGSEARERGRRGQSRGRAILASLPRLPGSAENLPSFQASAEYEDGLPRGVDRGLLLAHFVSGTRSFCRAPDCVLTSASLLSPRRALPVTSSQSAYPGSSLSVSSSLLCPGSPPLQQKRRRTGLSVSADNKPEATSPLVSCSTTALSRPPSASACLLASLSHPPAAPSTGSSPAFPGSPPGSRGNTDKQGREFLNAVGYISPSFVSPAAPSCPPGSTPCSSLSPSSSMLGPFFSPSTLYRNSRLASPGASCGSIASTSSSRSLNLPSSLHSSTSTSLGFFQTPLSKADNWEVRPSRAWPGPPVTGGLLLPGESIANSLRPWTNQEQDWEGSVKEEKDGVSLNIPECRTAGKLLRQGGQRSARSPSVSRSLSSAGIHELR